MRTRASVIFLIISAVFMIRGSSHAYTHHDSLIQWREYSPETFSAAARENKPIFLLITAVWCHWCHVFEEKVLETQEIADYVNSRFIPVFVDYDRRKDLVRKYPSYGLPSTVILTPGGSVLRLLPGYMPGKTFRARLDEVLKNAWARYKPQGPPESPSEAAKKLPTVEELKRFRAGFVRLLKTAYDRKYGGFGADVKEPYGHALYYALELYRETGDRKLKEMVTHTLDRIAGIESEGREGQRPDAELLFSLYRDKSQQGWLEKVEKLQRRHKIVGLLDPVEEGFFRLAILRDWGIPHFEKLLSVNAEMIKVYLQAYRITGREEYKDIAAGTLDYVLRVLYDPGQGLFYGSQTADEVYYHFTAEERAQVKPPPVDKTSYASATAEIVEALLQAYEVLGDERYSRAARKGLSSLGKELMGARGVMSYYDPREGKAHIDGQLMDNARVAHAFFSAAEKLKDEKYAVKAINLIDFALRELYDHEGGGFYERNSTSLEFYKEGEALSKEKPFDANGLMALNLLTAYRRTGKEVYLKRAEETLGAFVAGDVDAQFPFMLQAAGELIPFMGGSAE
jgi:hypothetical protein